MPGFTEFRFLDSVEDCKCTFQTQATSTKVSAMSKPVSIYSGNKIPKAYVERETDDPANPTWGTPSGQADLGDQVLVKVQALDSNGNPITPAKGFIIPRDGHMETCTEASLAILSSGATAFLRINDMLIPTQVTMGPWTDAAPFKFV
jgi:hypothetical protein